MTKMQKDFDAIVVGSGTCGATIARELSKQKKKVLILERGEDIPLKENLRTIASIVNQVKLGDGRRLVAGRALTAGGSTGLYFGLVSHPDLDVFGALGIDLSPALDAVKKELPIGPLPDELLSEQELRLRDSARALGHAWQKRDMLVDVSKCTSGYSYESKWKAKRFLVEAIEHGAILITRATVHKILVEDNVAIGVEYKVKTGLFRSELRRVFGTKIVLAAGELASPQILRDSGIKGVGNRGFFCNPGYAIYGLVPGMKGTDGFGGNMGVACDDGIELGDGNISRILLRPMMLSGLNLKHFFAYRECIGIGVKVKDGLGGRLKEDGGFYKQFDKDDYAKLDKGKQVAIKILEKAGATNIIDFGLNSAGRVGGLIRIGDHLDANLETAYRNLHVCDGSVVPDEMRGPPAFTLVCLAKYLSQHLLSTT